LPKDNNSEWKKQFHDESQSNYEDLSKSEKHNWIWGLFLILALAIFVVMFWGIRNHWEDINAQAQPSNDSSYQVSLAKTLSEMGDAIEKFSTATNINSNGSEVEGSPEEIKTESVTAQTDEMPVENLIAACANHDEVEYRVIVGPVLTPNKGFYYTEGMPTPEVNASWFLVNNGYCNWESISFLSLFDGRIINPVIKKDGEVFDLQTTVGKLLIVPGDQVEILIPYEVTQELYVDDEFVVIINKIPLVNHPHAIIKVDRWVIVVQVPNDSTSDQDSAPNWDDSRDDNQDGSDWQPTRPTPTPPR